MKLVTVASYSLAHEVHLAKSLLESKEIDVFILDEHIVGMNWLYSNAVGGVKVQVPEADLDKAKQVLASIENIKADRISEEDEKETCPKCSSENISFVSLGKKAAFLTWALLGIPLFFVRRRTNCNNCGYVWK